MFFSHLQLVQHLQGETRRSQDWHLERGNFKVVSNCTKDTDGPFWQVCIKPCLYGSDVQYLPTYPLLSRPDLKDAVVTRLYCLLYRQLTLKQCVLLKNVLSLLFNNYEVIIVCRRWCVGLLENSTFWVQFSNSLRSRDTLHDVMSFILHSVKQLNYSSWYEQLIDTFLQSCTICAPYLYLGNQYRQKFSNQSNLCF